MTADADPGDRRRSETVQSALYRIADLASAAQDMQEFYAAIHRVVGELMNATNFYIALYDDERQLINWPYWADEIDKDWPEPNEWVEFGHRQAHGTTGYVLRTGEPELITYDRFAELVERDEVELIGVVNEESSWLGVPLKAEGRTLGVLVVQSYSKDVQYDEQDKELLAFVGQHVGAALSRARAIEETRQRNAELALINSVQEALAGELELQAIYEVVGDKLQEVFDAQIVDISVYDETSGLLHFPYAIERGVRFFDEPIAPVGFRKHVMETRESLLLNQDLVEAAERYGGSVISGEMPKSTLFVPLETGGKVTGVISLQNIDREHAFSASDQQLLETLARSLSVALENARLVHETRQRNAELALINSVQEALAGELELQAIYDVVGDKVREVFDAQVVDIGIYDATAGLFHFPYTIERGVRYPDEPLEVIGFRKHVIETRETLRIDEDVIRESDVYGNPQVLTGEPAKSLLYVPLVVGRTATGVISLQNLDREHAFSASDQQLLETLARSLSVALENARLVHETRQRNAELALINSVQEALAGELELQAIYDVVGDRIQEIFDAQVVDIGVYDEGSGLIHFPYQIERGVRFPDAPMELIGFRKHVMDTCRSLMILEHGREVAERYGNPLVHVGEPVKSAVFVPLAVGSKATGVMSLQNIDREHAFSASDQQLLETLARSLSVALDNARLVHETRQRNAELALINSVQRAIAGELDPQAIYDLVGDRIQEVFDAQVVSISILDEATGMLQFPYVLERGARLDEEPIPLLGFRKHVIETREPLMIEESTPEVAERYGNPYVLSGEPVKSALFVPMIVSGRAVGVISIQNVDRTHAFSEADQRLLTTLCGSVSVALENARLVHETRQRNAELALINSVQQAIAGELDSQAIYDLVGDRIQEVFDAQVVSIAILEAATGMLQFPYVIERGERQQIDEMPLIGFRQHVMASGEPLMINENVAEAAEQYGNPLVLVGDVPKSDLFVPLIVGGRATGVISLQNVDREHAFTLSDQRLLVTLAGSLSVALENARLVHETRQRNAELALINSVQDSIAGELDPQAIYDLVGAKLWEVLDAQALGIAVHDEDEGLLRFVYQIERGVHHPNVIVPVIGFRKHVLNTREPLAILENMDAALVEYDNPETIVGEPSHGSAIFQPLVVGGRATGVIDVHNLDREHAFSDSDRQLIATIAGSLGVALENAQLIHETRQRVAELATVNRVGQALVSQLELDALIELVGERVRETFNADIAYVALHDEDSGQIDFVYYYETGERRPEPPIQFGQGVTSQILVGREPILLSRQAEYEGVPTLGTPSRSYLGVPILAGEKAIGVISVQSTQEEGRFAEPDARLLGTIASNVGVALENARLFAEIERQREHFESLVEISPVAVVVMDSEERVVGWNPAAAELFGHSAEEAIGRLVDDLVFDDDTRAEGREVTREALANGRAHRIAKRRRKDGSAVDVELMLVPLRVDDERVGFLGVYHDITELQRAREEAEAATQAKSAFLATMSHEIRTPMNAVIGMTGLLLGTELTPEQQEFAEVVRSSGDALLHVIDDILDYSKIEAGKLDLERAPFDLRECVEGTLDIVAPRASQKEIELACLIDEDVPAGILGDAARLRQVLLNLLSNAVKFTEEGEVVVHVSAEQAGPASQRVRLVVRDTGIGIPQDRMDRLFASFSQVDASTTRRYGGTGLGLAISKRLVELMGGTLSVESEEGEGSRFQIELKAREAEVPARIAADEGLPLLSDKRLLVVDDNATNREIVVRQARSWGMDPVAVEHPSAALALLEAGERFDVAVLDMLMPDMDGLELAHEIRSHRDANALPLLLLTSVGRLPGARASAEFAAQLAKPIKASQLFNALLSVLHRQGEPPIAEPAPESDWPATQSSLRILLAEDNAVNQKVALALLHRLGFRADVAWNGLEAVAALERRPYDVVLMDVQMPELDGLDATRRICERWPPESRPHIIAMTANALLEDREACFAAGMDDYLAKPVRPEELAAALSLARALGDDGRPVAEAEVRLEESALESLRELGGDEFLGEVVSTFLEDAPSLLASLRSELEQGDAAELRRAAHTLKTNGLTFGAAAFAELCLELEQRAKTGDLDRAGSLVDRIDQEYVALEQALTLLVPEPAS